MKKNILLVLAAIGILIGCAGTQKVSDDNTKEKYKEEMPEGHQDNDKYK